MVRDFGWEIFTRRRTLLEPAYFNTFFFFFENLKKIWSGTSIAEGLACSLLMTKIESDLNFVLKVIKHTEV